MKTPLRDRVLWFDGTNEVDASLVPELLLRGVSQDKIVASPNDDLNLFNQIADDPILAEKRENESFNLTWNIPDQFKQLDLRSFLFLQLNNLQQTDKRFLDQSYTDRIEIELKEIRNRNIEPLFKTLIFIVHELKKNNKVWGVGRGSSCASLVLFLIELHQVDPIRFGISHTEFFHD